LANLGVESEKVQFAGINIYAHGTALSEHVAGVQLHRTCISVLSLSLSLSFSLPLNSAPASRCGRNGTCRVNYSLRHRGEPRIFPASDTIGINPNGAVFRSVTWRIADGSIIIQSWEVHIFVQRDSI